VQQGLDQALHEPVVTSWCAQPLQGPSGQPEPAFARRDWISVVESPEPCWTLDRSTLGEATAVGRAIGASAALTARPDPCAVMNDGVTNDGGALFVPEPTFDAHGVAVAATGAAAGVALAKTLGFPRQLLEASGVKALDDARGADPDSAGSPGSPEPRGIPSFVICATRS